MSAISLSPGNSKLGKIPSVSLPSVATCRACDCQKKCYARKLERLRPAVRKAYQRNLDILISDPDTYWREVEASIMMSRFFRFHVSGDIPNKEYFAKMVEVAKRNPHCEILCFTKKYEIVNKYIENFEVLRYSKLVFPDCMFGKPADTDPVIPENLHIIFSAWDNLHMDNPYDLPVAYVKFRDGHTVAPSDAAECGGNCSECARTDDGCWTLKTGEAVVFDEH